MSLTSRLRIKKKYIRRGTLLLFVGFFVFGIWQLARGPVPTVPESFSSARLQGAAIASEIVDITSQSNSKLQQVSHYDRVGDYQAALNVVGSIEANGGVSERATQLTKELEIMARSLPEIYPEEARTRAQSAILAEVQLVNKLLAYNALYGQLLEEVRLKLRAHANGVSSPGVDLQSRIKDINREIRNINILNQEFLDSMKDFDRYFQE